VITCVALGVISNVQAQSVDEAAGTGASFSPLPPMQTSDSDPVLTNPPASIAYTGVHYWDRSGGNYLTMMDIDNDFILGWDIYLPTGRGADIYGRLVLPQNYLVWATQGNSRFANSGEVVYYAPALATAPYTFTNAWGTGGSGSMTTPSAHPFYSSCFFESFFDGSADNFSDDGGGSWSVDYVSDPGSYIDNRVYDSTGTGATGWVYSNYLYGYGQTQGFNFNADVRRMQNTGNSRGIIFVVDSSVMNYYAFYIGSTSYSLWRYDGGTPTSLIPWTATSYLNGGDAQWNNLMVNMVGGVIDLYLNGNYLNTYTDTTYVSGYCGVQAYNSTGTDTIQWDNLTLHRDSSKSPDSAGEIGALVPGDHTGEF
jgi:hypothetical protein